MHSEVETAQSKDDVSATSNARDDHRLAQKDTGIRQVGLVRRLFDDTIGSVRNPEFWVLSAWLDIVVTYRRSRLGAIWLLVPSIIYVWVVGTLFSLLWGRTIADFVAYMALGWVVYTLMNSTIMHSTNALWGARPYIMDGRMRLTDFVLRAMAKAFFHFLMAMPMVIVAVAIYPGPLHVLGVLTGIGGLALVLVDTFLVGVIFSLAGARFPDIHDLVSNVLRVLYFLTPILWDVSRMPPDSLRGKAARLNPFFHLIEVFRAPILDQPLKAFSWYYVAVMTVALAVLAAFLYRRYARVIPVWL